MNKKPVQYVCMAMYIRCKVSMQSIAYHITQKCRQIVFNLQNINIIHPSCKFSDLPNYFPLIVIVLDLNNHHCFLTQFFTAYNIIMTQNSRVQ